MKKLLLVLALVLSVVVVNAQNKKTDFEIAGGVYYGVFAGDHISDIYPDYGAFDLSFIIDTRMDWLSAGLFIKQIKASGEPMRYEDYGEGLDYVGRDGDCDLKMFSWGPEVSLNISKTFHAYARYGFLKVKESGQTSMGGVETGDLKGRSFDLGLKGYLPIGKNGFNLFGKAGYSFVSLNDIDMDGELNSWDIGIGVCLKF